LQLAGDERSFVVAAEGAEPGPQLVVELNGLSVSEH